MEAAYKLLEGMIGVINTDGKPFIVKIPAGSVVSIPSNARWTGLVRVQCEGRGIEVFSQDLLNRSERIARASSGAGA